MIEKNQKQTGNIQQSNSFEIKQLHEKCFEPKS
jgi:hypothetical protein